MTCKDCIHLLGERKQMTLELIGSIIFLFLLIVLGVIALIILWVTK